MLSHQVYVVMTPELGIAHSNNCKSCERLKKQARGRPPKKIGKRGRPKKTTPINKT